MNSTEKFYTKEYSFVIDKSGKPLAPTPANNAWYLVRKGKAALYHKYPMVIKLNREVNINLNEGYEFVLGIDDGSEYVGIAIIQKCSCKNKLILKGVINHRKDVHKLMMQRKDFRKSHRRNKRYRAKRFNNRLASRRKDRVLPTIKQKRDVVIRLINKFLKWVNISSIFLEDVKIDIRALTDGHKLFPWEYNKSNRLDENLRTAAIIRDENTCQYCGKKNTKMEVHHIIPRRKGGVDNINNLVTLCESCHRKVTGHEHNYEKQFFNKINGRSINLKHAQHVMQGKLYLRKKLSDITTLILTTGCDTANTRNNWNIEKSHSNDAICATKLKVYNLDLKEWTIKPIRKKKSINKKYDEVLGFQHRDIVNYTYKNGEYYQGYVTALYPEINALSFKSLTKQCNKVNAKKCKLLWRPKNFFFI